MNPDDLIARLTAAGLTDPDCLSMVRVLATTEAAHVQQWSEIQRILTDAGVPTMSVVQRVKALADSLAPGLPEGWVLADRGTGTPEYVRYEARGPALLSVVLYRYNDGRVCLAGVVAPPAVYAYLLARAQGVGS